MKRWVLLFLLLAAVTAVPKTKESLPDQGVIPDEVTAVKVAEAIFSPIFGQERLISFVLTMHTSRTGSGRSTGQFRRVHAAVLPS